MRAGRLLELLVRLQLRGGASAVELAKALEVSVRTIYRDVEALSAAGVPVYTELGRNGGIRIDPSYRVAGLPRLEADEARGVLFAAVPALAAQLGLDPGAAEETLLPAMESSTERAARAARDRLLVEPSHWFVPPDDTPALATVARAVWDAREVRLTYRGADLVVQPLGLVLKGYTWYLLGHPHHSGERPYRLFRLSRVEAAEMLERRFDRPSGFDLGATWAQLRQSFIESIPAYLATVRIAPAAEPLLRLLDEATRPPLPLTADVERDEQGWAVLRLRFERPEHAARHLLRLGAEAEVLDPPELRALMADTVRRLAFLYAEPDTSGS